MGIPVINKERVYMSGGRLKYSPTWNRIRNATDVRWCKIDPCTVKEVRFMYEKGKNVSEIVSMYKADLGTNFPFFYNGLILGDSEDEDKVISAAYGKMLKWHEFAWIDGKPRIGQLDKADRQDLLLQGAPLLVNNGREVWDYYRAQQQVQDDIGKSSCQRTFFGIDKNNHLICAWADGRAKTDKGLTLQEMAKFMLDKGAVVALNGDGGGSTSVSVRDRKTGKLSMLNANRSNPRDVHHALLFWFK